MRAHRTSRLSRTATAVGALTLGLALALTACGDDSSDSSAPASSTQHNDADVAFATDMIQHHAQALSMVDLTLDRPLDPEVEQLAEDIRAAQGPEIETMTDWLEDWGQEVPATMRDHTHAGHDMDDMGESMEDMDHGDMPGMMSAEDMVALEEATDAEFQDMWLQMMIEHHTGAVEMARTEQEDGQYEPALDLAEQIITAQEAEIEKMNTLLGS